MSYPKAEMIIDAAPLHTLVMVEPVTQELYGDTTFIPDPDGIRRELLIGGWQAKVHQELLEDMCERVQLRLDGSQGRQGFAPAT